MFAVELALLQVFTRDRVPPGLQVAVHVPQAGLVPVSATKANKMNENLLKRNRVTIAIQVDKISKL